MNTATRTLLYWLPDALGVATLAECRCPMCWDNVWDYCPPEPADPGEGPTWGCPMGGAPPSPAMPERAACRNCGHEVEHDRPPVDT